MCSGISSRIGGVVGDGVVVVVVLMAYVVVQMLVAV